MSDFSPVTVNVIPDSAVDLAQEVYSDGAKQTLSEAGKIVGRVPRFINAALVGFDKWMLSKEYNYKETEKLLEKKLINVDPDKLVNPEPYVAVPALQAISYSIGSKELSNMYANLLAKSMHVDMKDYVHPSFVEIIKQLSPTDAKVFAILSNHQQSPIVDLVKNNPDDSFELLADNITGLDIADHLIQSASINNLEKQGLLKIKEEIIIEESFYSAVTKSNEYKQLVNAFTYPRISPEVNMRHIRITALGNLFKKICIIDSIHQQ